MKIISYTKVLKKALDLAKPINMSYELENQSASKYFLERYDEELLELFAYPLLSELLLGNPEFNSKLAFLSTLACPAVFSIDEFENDMGTVPEYLARILDVRLNTPVNRIEKAHNNGYKIYTGGENEEIFQYDAVILAAPLPSLADILVYASDELKSSMKDIIFSPAIVTSWGLDDRYERCSMINNFLRNETKTISTVVFDHLKSASRVPEGKGLVTVILKEAASRELFESSDAQIQSAVLAEMEKVFPSFGSQVTFAKTYRWEHAALQFPPGALKKKQVMKRMFSQEFENIYIASDSLHRTSIETCLKSGIQAAMNIIDTFNSGDS